MLMIMKRFDGAGIAKSGGHVRCGNRKACGDTLADAKDFHEIPAIVGPDGMRLHNDAVDQIRRLWRVNQFPNSLLALWIAERPYVGPERRCSAHQASFAPPGLELATRLVA